MQMVTSTNQSIFGDLTQGSQTCCPLAFSIGTKEVTFSFVKFGDLWSRFSKVFLLFKIVLTCENVVCLQDI